MGKWSELYFWKEKFPEIKTFLDREEANGKSILPDKANRFNAFVFTPRDKVKVVLLGQDPYPNHNHAMGLAFSVLSVPPWPPSLLNIYKELRDDVAVVRLSPSLVDWAKQGVLLLNTSLTVEEGKSNSHADIGWNELTKEVIKTLSVENDGLVFILWGAKAQAYARFINDNRHMIIKSAHPSPLSAHNGFFGSRPFSKANAYLEACGKEPIKW